MISEIARQGESLRNISEMFATVVEQRAGQTAVVDARQAITYNDLGRRVARLSACLEAQGVRKGDRVALVFPNGLDFVTSFLSIVELGAVAVPVNPQYQRDETRYMLDASNVSLIVTSQELAQRTEPSPLDEPGGRCFFVDKPAVPFENPAVANHRLAPEPDSIALLQFSSGSTGSPKRILRTHANLLVELDGLINTLRVTEKDRILGVMPFSHVNGLMRSMMMSVRAGATLYSLASFDRRLVMEVIEKNEISIFIGVPFMFCMLARTSLSAQPDLSSLRLCISASAPMPKRLNEQFHAKFGRYVRQLYGSTETGTISVNLSTDIDKSLESVGKPIGGVKVEIFTEDGRPARANEIGEIGVKSLAAITGYDNLEELDSSIFRDGCFMTGDLGFQDERGLLYLVGRKKIFINKAGYKINPREIETFLESHPKVDEAMVLGLPSPYGDERVKAVIVPNALCREEEIVEYCRGKIADFKIPSFIEFAETLPISVTGKLRRSL
jgi:long-chain acyl-CoA synthetase